MDEILNGLLKTSKRLKKSIRANRFTDLINWQIFYRNDP